MILEDALRDFPPATLQPRFVDQDECLVIEDFLPPPWRRALQDAAVRTSPAVHRSFLPGHKKSGSVSRHCLDRQAPAVPSLYRSPALLQWLEALCGRSLLFSPASDPHAYALYHYSEVGDHIGWHYDTSYYRGARYTVLLGIVDDSSSRLEYRLFTRSPGRQPVQGAIAIRPGTLVFFNGDKLQHRVTPLGRGEQRVVLTFRIPHRRPHRSLGPADLQLEGRCRLFRRPSRCSPRGAGRVGGNFPALLALLARLRRLRRRPRSRGVTPVVQAFAVVGWGIAAGDRGALVPLLLDGLAVSVLMEPRPAPPAPRCRAPLAVGIGQ